MSPGRQCWDCAEYLHVDVVPVCVDIRRDSEDVGVGDVGIRRRGRHLRDAEGRLLHQLFVETEHAVRADAVIAGDAADCRSCVLERDRNHETVAGCDRHLLRRRVHVAEGDVDAARGGEEFAGHRVVEDASSRCRIDIPARQNRVLRQSDGTFPQCGKGPEFEFQFLERHVFLLCFGEIGDAKVRNTGRPDRTEVNRLRHLVVGIPHSVGAVPEAFSPNRHLLSGHVEIAGKRPGDLSIDVGPVHRDNRTRVGRSAVFQRRRHFDGDRHGVGVLHPDGEIHPAAGGALGRCIDGDDIGVLRHLTLLDILFGAR
ncbi:hypothetical protein C1G86_0953 [Dehalococcoides mccartyi]|uniref:Uncharacterized protein n=1 Tax=Dehalococcoides mccartyi TaxID=61435 RepID=A0A328EPK9_9CHLR|nr:hypothetical protein C1G87_1519 [Dehalococcoides mccartyi]RAL70575.1 hypothetical protein C1G86_0953 [Dehalococcoides mccartyi]